MGHEHTVLLAQRHHVGYRAERDQVEVAPQVGKPVVPARPELRAQPHEQVEDHARAREPLEGKRAPRLERVQERQHGRSPCGRVMVVADDHVEPQVGRVRERALVRRAAVGGHHDACPGGAQAAERARVEPVALAAAVRDVEQRLGAELAQAEHELGGARDAVHVVVAVDRDRLAGRQRVGQPRGRARHVLQQEGRA